MDSSIWRIMPGRGGSDWPEWLKHGCIAIGWADFDDLRSLGDFEKLDQYLRDRGGEGKDQTARTIVPFIEQMQIGDLVISGGVSNVFGIGTITSEYLPKSDPTNPTRHSELPHARTVEWHSTKSFKLPPHTFRRDTLERVSPERWEIVRQTLSADFNEVLLHELDAKTQATQTLLRRTGAGVLADLDAGALEGDKRLAFLAHYHRDSALRQKFLESQSSIACVLCNYDFFTEFGELGAGFAQVHHEDQLARREGATLTTPDKMKVVCPNCHAMIHRGGACRSLDEMRKIRDAARKRVASAS